MWEFFFTPDLTAKVSRLPSYEKGLASGLEIDCHPHGEVSPRLARKGFNQPSTGQAE